MTTINLKDFYPWYKQDEYIEVPNAVAEELLADQRYEKAHRRRIYRNKAHYTLDADNGIEASVSFSAPSPCAVLEYGQTICRLCRALNSLTVTQGRRIEAHYILGMSKAEIARVEGTAESSVKESIYRGLENMKKYMKNHQ